MAKKEEKTVVKAESAGTLAEQLGAEFDFGGEAMFNFRDLIIPKLFIMQGLSKLVASGDAKMGDIVDTAANEIIGSVREKDKKPVRFYPMQMYRYWVHRKFVDNELKYDGATPWTPANADMAWDIMDENGKKVGTNEETVVFAVVPEANIDNLEEPPRLLTFRKTGLKQTKQLKHHFLMCLSTKKELPFQTVFELSGKLDKNEAGQSWYLPECFPKGKADEETARKIYAIYQRYGKMIKEKIAGSLDDEMDTQSQGASATERDVQGAVVEAEGERAKF